MQLLGDGDLDETMRAGCGFGSVSINVKAAKISFGIALAKLFFLTILHKRGPPIFFGDLMFIVFFGVWANYEASNKNSHLMHFHRRWGRLREKRRAKALSNGRMTMYDM